jgi:hypothetical protein
MLQVALPPNCEARFGRQTEKGPIPRTNHDALPSTMHGTLNDIQASIDAARPVAQ